MADGSGPVLTSLVLSDIALDSYGAYSELYGAASDATAAIDHIDLTLDAPLPLQGAAASPSLTLSSFEDGAGRDPIVLSSDASERTYNVESATVYDTAGASTTYTAAQLQAMHIQTSFTVGAIGASNDVLRPVLSGLGLPANIVTSASGAPETFSAYAGDNGQSGVAQVTYQLDRPLQTTNGPVSSFTFSTANGTLASYGSGSIQELVTSATASGVYNVTGATVTDAAGNTMTYSAADLHAIGLTTSFTVDDKTTPTLTAFTVDPVDVTNSAASPLVHATTADAAGNAEQIVLTLDRPVVIQEDGVGLHGLHGAFETSTLTVGAQGGYANGYGPLDEETKAGVYTITQAVVSDYAGNSTTYSTAQLAAMGFSTGLTVTADDVAPTLTGLSLPSSPVSPGDNVPFSVAVTDTGSTIGLVNASLHFDRLLSGYNSASTEIDLDNTSTASGPVTASYNPGYFPSGDTDTDSFYGDNLQPGLYRLTAASVSDFADNTRDYNAAQLQSMGYATAFVVATPVQFDGDDHAADGFYAFTGSADADQLSVNGNVWDYTLSRQAVPGSGSQVDGQGDFVLTANNGGSIYYIDQSVDSIRFQDGQYLALKDLSAYIAAGPSPTSGAFDDGRVYQQEAGGYQAIQGDAEHQIAVLNGNPQDYTERAFTGVLEPDGTPLAGVELIAANGSGAIFVDSSIGTVQFLNGQQVALGDIGEVVSADHSQAPDGTLHLPSLDAPQTYTVSGTDGDDVLFVNEPAGYESLSRGSEGQFILSFGPEQITIDPSIATVQFSNGQYLALKDLPAYVYGDATFTQGGAGDDILVAGRTGDQYLVGGAGTDLAELHGNSHDYLVRAVDLPAQNGEPAIDGYELLAINNSGNIYIDSSTERVQWQDGTSVAFADLPSATLGVVATTPTGGHDIFVANPQGDQYFNGGGGQDDLYLLGNTSDYTLQSVNFAATGSHPAVDGYELIANNGSGNLYIDQSIATVHFQNGQYLAFQDLPHSIT